MTMLDARTQEGRAALDVAAREQFLVHEARLLAEAHAEFFQSVRAAAPAGDRTR